MSDTSKAVTLISLFIIASTFLVIVVWKAISAAMSVTVTLAEWVASVLSWLVNALIVLGAVTGVAVAVLIAVWILVALFEQIQIKLDNILTGNHVVLTRLKELVAGKPEKIAPIVIAGVVQTLILVLKDSAINPTLKLLLSCSVWTLATLLNLTVAEWKPNQTFGRWGIILMVLIPLGVGLVVTAYLGFFDPSKLQEKIVAIRTWFNNQNFEDKMAGIMIAAFIMLMPVASYILWRGRQPANTGTAEKV